MAKPLFPKPAPRWQLWACLAGAVLIEGAAVAVAGAFTSPYSDHHRTKRSGAAARSHAHPDSARSADRIAPASNSAPARRRAERVCARATDPPPRLPQPARVQTPRAENQLAPAQFSAARANRTHAPRPPYPYEARRAHSTGSGKFLLRFDANGAVVAVTVVQSTGNAMLDQISTSTFRRWRCRPGGYREVYVPISFTFQGAQW